LLDEVHKAVRKQVAFAQQDRVFSDDIEKGIAMIREARLVEIVEKACKREKLSMETPYSELFDTY
jgi:histidine ammonia-lyase